MNVTVRSGSGVTAGCVPDVVQPELVPVLLMAGAPQVFADGC